MIPAIVKITIDAMLFNSEPIVWARCTRRLASRGAGASLPGAALCLSIGVGMPAAARAVTRSIIRCSNHRATNAIVNSISRASGLAISQSAAWANQSFPVSPETQTHHGSSGSHVGGVSRRLMGRTITRARRPAQTEFDTLWPVTKPGFPRSRAAIRAFALTPAALVVTGVSPALASAPDQWDPVEQPTPFNFLLLLVLIPGALFVVIVFLSALPSMIKGDSTYQPGLAWRNEPEWFGGPRDGLDKADQQAQVEAGQPPDRGGASARW